MKRIINILVFKTKATMAGDPFNCPGKLLFYYSIALAEAERMGELMLVCALH
jgi:hypothetical protein